MQYSRWPWDGANTAIFHCSMQWDEGITRQGPAGMAEIRIHDMNGARELLNEL